MGLTDSTPEERAASAIIEHLQDNEYLDWSEAVLHVRTAVEAARREMRELCATRVENAGHAPLAKSIRTLAIEDHE